MSEPLRIDYVSPLPPVRSGIADYSLDLLPALSERCDVRLIHLPGQAVDDSVAERWPLVPASETGSEGRLPVYHMGNNRYHEAILDLARERPGILTLHDIVLHHLTSELTLADGVPEPYREALARDHGWIGVAVGRARNWGEVGSAALFLLHAHRSLLRRQRGVLVHSEWAATLLREECAGLGVRAVPMGVPLSPAVEAGSGRDFRERYGLPLDRPLLGSFGFQTPIKRTSRVIEALARPELATAHLLVAGEVSGLDLEAEATEHGVRDRVHLAGFLPFEDFEAGIAACDLCLNLRYPTAGETSASLLRVLAVGRPVIVSEFAQFAEMPDEIAVKVPLGEEEVTTLARTVGELLAEPERLEEMGRAAREHVRTEHDPEKAAEAVVAGCLALREREPAPETQHTVPPPTTLSWRRLPGRIEIEGAELPWVEGERRRLRVKLTNDSFASWLASENNPGGVVVEFQWRRREDAEPLYTTWFQLPADLHPGENRTFEVETRRPLDAGSLVLEPHLKGGAGLRALNGPVWECSFE